MSEHVSADGLERLARGEMSADDLHRADQHFRSCDACLNRLAGILPSGAGMLAAVRREAHRHLTVEELESCLDNEGERALDPLAASHLETCVICRRELEDLLVFDALPARAQDPDRASARPSLIEKRGARGAAWLFKPLAWAGALASVILLVAILPRMGPFGSAPNNQLVVQLAPEGEARTPDGPRALRSGSSRPLPNEVSLQIARARITANQTGRPEVLELRVSGAEYGALLEELGGLGTLDRGLRSPQPGAEGRETVRVSVTLVPARSSGKTEAR